MYNHKSNTVSKILNNCIRCPMRWMQLNFLVRPLYEHSDDTRDNREQCNTLYEGSSQDHVSTDIA